MGGSDNLSVISENTVTSKITFAEKNLSKMDNNRARELEKCQMDLDEAQQEIAELKVKYKAAIARRDTLEK